MSDQVVKIKHRPTFFIRVEYALNYYCSASFLNPPNLYYYELPQVAIL